MLGDFCVDVAELDRAADALEQAKQRLDAITRPAESPAEPSVALTPRAKLNAAAAASTALLAATAKGSSSAVSYLENRLRETAAAYRSVDAESAELIRKALGEVGA